jgi:hypothetical protein
MPRVIPVVASVPRSDRNLEASALTMKMRRMPPGGRSDMATFVLVHGAWHGGWC